MSGGGNLFERKVAVEMRAHEFDGAANATVHESDAREFEFFRAASRSSRSTVALRKLTREPVPARCVRVAQSSK